MKTIKACQSILCLVILASSVLSASVYSQSNTPSQQQLDQAQQAGNSQRVDVSQYIQTTQNPGQQATLPPQSQPVTTESDVPPPFGANMFTSLYESQRTDGLNPDYKVAPGDKVSIQLWGTVNLAEVFTVDSQGNLFVPQVGPIKVEGVPATEINNVVAQKIKSVYTNNVNVYVNLLTATPVGVYVTGPVLRPGQYAGLASDSVLFYLQRAGGIDPDRGSYRKVTVLRNDQVVVDYDLYDFLTQGKLKPFSFRDGDVVLVGEQGAVVTVEGAARYPFRFELTEQKSMGKDLIHYARPLAKTSHVAITGNRQKGPISVYLPFAEFEPFEIRDGDEVLFNDDLRPQVISVQLSGSYIGPSFYTVEKSTRLMELLDHIEVDPALADIGSIYIKRERVKEQQKQLLEDSLQRLERSIFTAPASSDGESRIRAQEAQLVMQFVTRARAIEPLGKVILSSDGKVANVRLEQGDEIVIPLKTDLIQISGEVLIPQAVVFNENATIEDYVAWAGGFSERAETDRIAIIHPNGLTTFVDTDSGGHWYSESSEYQIKPGDQILILPRVDTKILQAVKDITQIIYQIAVAANVALN